MLEAQRQMREQIRDVTFCLMIATTLHSIAVGNLLPAWVKVVCVDINPSTVIKLTDRGIVPDRRPGDRRRAVSCGRWCWSWLTLEAEARAHDRSRSILMCPPDFYGIEYEINPWMDRDRQADHALARAQWTALTRALEAAGGDGRDDAAGGGPARPGVHGQRGHDLPRPGDAGPLPPSRAAGGRAATTSTGSPRTAFAVEHAAERRVLRRGRRRPVLRRHALRRLSHPQRRPRASARSASVLGCRVIPLELVDPHYYHLDTCFCPLGAGRGDLLSRRRSTHYAAAVLRELVAELIAVSDDEAQRFACNAVVVGQHGDHQHRLPGTARARLRARGFTPRETPLDEFVKAGGSAKCLTLRLDGEDAASWRNEPAAGGRVKTLPRRH